MSRIGKKPIQIPGGVNVTIAPGRIAVKGPKGELVQELHPQVSVAQQDQAVLVAVSDPEQKRQKALWGLFGSIIRNMMTGVTSGFTKQLEINGVGFKVALKKDTLEFALGFSHPVVFKIPKGIVATVEKNIITISGADKQLVGQTAAEIRKLKKPEPYKGKGIKYVDEVLRRKAGKAAAKE